MVDANRYTCSGCAFQVRSENSDEVVDIIQTHARDAHDMRMSEQEVVDGMESVDV